jgi:hypothetical protein
LTPSLPSALSVVLARGAEVINTELAELEKALGLLGLIAFSDDMEPMKKSDGLLMLRYAVKGQSKANQLGLTTTQPVEALNGTHDDDFSELRDACTNPCDSQVRPAVSVRPITARLTRTLTIYRTTVAAAGYW